MRRRFVWNAMALCSLWAAAWASPAFAGDMHAEDAVKAAFVLRFAGYVEWPEAAAAAGSFNIVVLGDSELALHLQTLAAGRSVMNRPIQVRRIASIKDAGDAQVLYIGSDRRNPIRDLLPSIAGRSVLVVSDEDNALDSGSTINLRTADQRVRFEVSLPSARQAHLRISSDLLALAVRVRK
ncbi:MAG: YfiR family protein [Pseudomonadota bacterium]